MKQIKDQSIDMVLCDLPYGTTSCKWDTVIPFEPLWAQYERVIKKNGAMVFTAAQPFTTTLINSNKRLYRYSWYWIKNQVTGFPFAKYQPLRCVEDVVVFYKAFPTYNPQGLIRLDEPVTSKGKKYVDSIYKAKSLSRDTKAIFTNYPKQTLFVSCQREGLHPTQKPVALFEYLIQTYTNPGDIVLDNCMGSGTTAIACINTKRRFIGFEQDEKYCEIARKRIKELV